jgi:GT2 family glycosyltransferase
VREFRFIGRKIFSVVDDELEMPGGLPLPHDVDGLLASAGERQQPGAPSVDVVICVRDAREDVHRCLWSLLASTGRRLRLILIDDGSAAPTRELLARFAATHPAVTLIRRSAPPHGYALAANAGLRASASDYAVLLNSDTIVTHGWLERLVRHGERHRRVGILGPLSNAAGHQSVPAVREHGAWALNPPAGWLPIEGAALAVERAPRVDVRLPFINGFCYTIKRAVLDAVGLLDEHSFPGGYCEENDYSQRARNAGFDLAVVDDAYVYHANSRSYGERRSELAPRNYQTFLDKHGPEKIRALVAGMEADRTLAPLRAAFAQATASPLAFAGVLGKPLRIAFLRSNELDGEPPGPSTLAREIQALRDLGIPAQIVVGNGDLLARTADAEAIVATDTASAAALATVWAARKSFLPAYALSEPPFAAGPPSERAIAFCAAVPGTLLLARTHSLCSALARHGLRVAKIESSSAHAKPRVTAHEGAALADGAPEAGGTALADRAAEADGAAEDSIVHSALSQYLVLARAHAARIARTRGPTG